TTTSTSVVSLAIDHDANSAAFDPNGRSAVLFEAPQPGLARRNFHDVSVLVLDEGSEHLVRAVVGYGPSRVTFDAAGTRAIVITGAGISEIDRPGLPGQGPLRPPLLGWDTPEEVGETQIAPDASFALARFGASELRLLDLRDATIAVAELSAIAESPEV